MTSIKVATIGFTKTTAEDFFERLVGAQVKKIVDVRLHNSSQLAAFAKSTDLAYFLRRIAGIQYEHRPMLAPTDSMLEDYKKKKQDWQTYQGRFLQLMADRKIENALTPDMLEGACLLCSESKPHHCHRRLVCEYLNSRWHGALQVKHL